MRSLSRRQGLVLWPIAALVSAIVVLWNARHVAPYRPKLERIYLTVPPEHAALEGMTLGFITDTHISPAFRPAHLRRAVALLAEARPDVVLFGGDYASETTRFAGDAARVLGDVAACSPLGGYAVLGNHDEQLDSDKVVAAFEQSGIPMLRNEARPLVHNGARLWIVGLDDALAGHNDPARAFRDVPRGAASIVVWHEPDWAEEAACYGPFAQLSGHTHGGQIRLPFVSALALPPGGRRYDAGFFNVDGMRLYISRGVGVYRPPIRFRCPPELTLITLRADR
jgi:predicted MPP superfamily phosphohydrolase